MRNKLVLSAALVLGLSMAGFAQSSDTTTPNSDQKTQNHHHNANKNQRMMMDPDAMVNHLDKELSLSADQKTKIKTIVENASQQATALHNNSSSTDKQQNREAM